MQRKDVERVKAEALTREDEYGEAWVLASDYAELLDRAEKAEAERDALQGQLNDLRNGWANSVKAHAALLAERDAAFAAGQESMRERAADVVWGVSDAGYTTHSDMEDAIRSLPIDSK